jgi:hypothetical protein
MAGHVPQAHRVVATPRGQDRPVGHLRPLGLPSTIAVRAGRHVSFVIANADSARRILSIPALGIYMTIAAARAGAPSVTTVSVTPRRAGLYTWRLLASCSGGAATSGRIMVLAPGTTAPTVSRASLQNQQRSE